MAFLERRGDWFRVIFRFQGRRFAHSFGTKSVSVAEGLKGGIERTLMLLDQNVLTIPHGIDPFTFIVSNGQVEPAAATATTTTPDASGYVQALSSLTLAELRDRYVRTHSGGAIEQNSLATVTMHLRHVIKTLGGSSSVQDLSPLHLQEHIDRRAKKRGFRKRPLSPATLRKKIASFRAVWNWAADMGLVTGAFPNRGLRFPKSTEKPPFQTWAEIERQIARGGLTDAEQRDLWDCLFLTLPEVADLLRCVKDRARHSFIYPMFCFAAHTGARRSEMLRMRIGDVDLEGGTVLIREKKRTREKRTMRRVPLSPFLASVLKEFLARHPGGPFLFCHELHVERSKTKRTECAALTRNEANDHFKRTVAGTKWDKLRGWHVFRHSFASNAAAKGIDQRLIDEWLGHQTEEMRRRYRHCFPNQQREAIRKVFG